MTPRFCHFVTSSVLVCAAFATEPRGVDSADALIDALANQNPAPLIYKTGDGSAPDFDDHYDWQEQARVVAAIHKLAASQDPKLWDRLMAHAKDTRYAITFDDEVSSRPHCATNWTVGRICREIADFQVHFPMHEVTHDLGSDDSGRPWSPEPGIGGTGGKQPRNTLAERQIGLCEDALAELATSNMAEWNRDLNDAVIARCRERLRAMIERIRKTQTGIIAEYRFTGERFQLYTPAQAAQLSENHRAREEGRVPRDMNPDQTARAREDDEHRLRTGQGSPNLTPEQIEAYRKAYEERRKKMKEQLKDINEAAGHANGAGKSGHLKEAAEKRAAEVPEMITNFCKRNLGKKVGNGECWTLADEAFKACGLKRPGADMRVWGRIVDFKKEMLQPGDIAEFRSARFSDGYRTASEHTAVIVKGAKRSVVIAEQNWGGNKTVHEKALDLGTMERGTVTIYRPE